MARVLILDDHTLVAQLLKEELTQDGHQVLTSSDPTEAILSIQLFVPDILIMDPFLRNRPRWDVLRQIKSSLGALPVIIYTGHQGYAQDPNMEMARAFLIKRSSMEGIRLLVQEVSSGENPAVSLGEKELDSFSKTAKSSGQEGNLSAHKQKQASLQKKPPDGRQGKQRIDLSSRR